MRNSYSVFAPSVLSSRHSSFPIEQQQSRPLDRGKKLYFCVAVSVQSSGFCSSEIFSVVVVPAARSIRNLLDSSVRITLCLHSSKYGLCEFLTIQITPLSAAGDVCAVFICVCVCVCVCVHLYVSVCYGKLVLSLGFFRHRCLESREWRCLKHVARSVAFISFPSFCLLLLIDMHFAHLSVFYIWSPVTSVMSIMSL